MQLPCPVAPQHLLLCAVLCSEQPNRVGQTILCPIALYNVDDVTSSKAGMSSHAQAHDPTGHRLLSKTLTE
jgi:hypothetical protein